MSPNLPKDVRELILQYLTEFKMWNILDDWFHAFPSSFVLTPYTDFDFFAHGNQPVQDTWEWFSSFFLVEHIICFANAFDRGNDFDYGDSRGEYNFEKWTSGNSDVDERAATTCLYFLLQKLASKVRVHHCYSSPDCKMLTTKKYIELDYTWCVQTINHEVYDDLMLGRILRKFLTDYRLEDI